MESDIDHARARAVTRELYGGVGGSARTLWSGVSRCFVGPLVHAGGKNLTNFRGDYDCLSPRGA